ncbi:MAG: permease-like cell division protein FtsX, partial [Megasphaera lornae]
MKIRYFMSEACKSFWRNSFMSIASIVTVALSFFILGIFAIMVANLDNFADNLENQVQISVYLKDGLTTEQVMGVGKRLKALPEVRQIKFTNKDQAMTELKERMKDQPGILEALEGKNPLPTS